MVEHALQHQKTAKKNQQSAENQQKISRKSAENQQKMPKPTAICSRQSPYQAAQAGHGHDGAAGLTLGCAQTAAQASAAGRGSIPRYHIGTTPSSQAGEGFQPL